MSNNELWPFQSGYIAGYTEDKALMDRIKRYKFKQGWLQFASYTNNKGLTGMQYRIPIEQRRVAERMFDTKLSK